jgi:16S rRNA (guanine527-N7)-methyltransferase
MNDCRAHVRRRGGPYPMVSVDEGLVQLGIEANAAQRKALVAHLDLVDEWNTRFNLTAIRDREQQITKHVLDSLTVLPWLRGERIADIGSGAGFPGIPLAIVEPGRHFALIESTGKKCRFLETVRDTLGLTNVEIVQGRAESQDPDRQFDTVVARAVGPLSDLVRYAGPLLATGGRLIAMKGRDPAEELARKLNGWKLAGVSRVTVPGLEEERHVVELVRSHDKTDP